MNVEELNSRIAVVNGESKRLNNERQVNIGKRETLTKQLNDALASYKSKYGVDLTVDNLQSELARVMAEKDAEVSKIESMLSLIKAGDYDGANRLIEGTTEQPVEEVPNQPSAPVVETPVQQVPVVGETVAEIPKAPVIEEPVADVPKAPVIGSPVPEMPKPPVIGAGVEAEQTVPPVAPPPVIPKAPVISGLNVGEVEKTERKDDGLFPPAGQLGKPPVAPVQTETKQKPAMSFGAIVGGTPFTPQG